MTPLLALTLFLFQPMPVTAENILVISDSGDGYAKELTKHLNVSFLYYNDLDKIDNLHVQFHYLTGNSNENDVCNKLVNTSILISLTRSAHSKDLITRIATKTGIPTIHAFGEHWTLPLAAALSGPVAAAALLNYAVLVPPATVLQDVLADIFTSLNIASGIVVIFDDMYDPSYTAWQEAFTSLPVPSRFVKLEGKGRMLQQMNDLQTGTKNVFLVAKTENIEQFTIETAIYMEDRKINFFVLTKDITPFKCDDCSSANWVWIRPYHTGKITQIRNINEFLSRNELGNELNYKIFGWEELDVAFSMDVMDYAFTWILNVNSSLGQIKPPEYKCSSFTSNEYNITLRDIVLSENNHEYGVYVEQSPNQFFQNVEARIFKIDRTISYEDAYFNKELGYWTVINKLTTYYGSLDVDARNSNHFRIVTLIQPPFVQYSNDPSAPYEGYCIDLINLIAAEVNFTYTIYEVEDGSYGTIDDNGNWNGLIGAVSSGCADMALAPLSVMAERENDIDFTVPYYDLVGTTILMKKPDVEYSLFKFMQVLEWPVWLSIVGAYILTSLLLWVFERFSPYSYTNNKAKYKEDREQRVFNLKECLWFCMTSLTPQGGGEAPKNISGRLVAATWWLFGFIIIASYTANLAAFLTVSRLEQPISSLDDLAKQYKIEYAPIKGSASETYFRRMAEIEEQFYMIWKEMSLNESMSPRDRSKLAVWDYPVSDKYTNMWRYMQESKLPPNMDAAIQRVLTSQDGFAFIGDATEIKYAALTNCKLQQVGTEFSRKPYAIAVQTNHVLKDPMSSAILMLLNQRKLETLKEKWWNQNPNRMNCPVSSDESDGISIKNIGGVFIVILTGIFLSIITLGVEYFFYRRKNAALAKQEEEIMEGKEDSYSRSSTTSLPPPPPSAHNAFQNEAFQY